MKRYERIISVSFLLLSAIGATRYWTNQNPVVTHWNVRVVDAISGNPVPGMAVEVRSKDLAAGGYMIQATTDSAGRATLEHADGYSATESVIALGNDDYHYTSRSGVPEDGPTTLYVMPFTAFWKSPIISASTGSGGPMTIAGQMDGPLGAFPYAIDVTVPPGVLPADSQVWIAARPLSQAVNNGFPVDHVPAHFGQLHIQLRDAEGTSVITDQLANPGIQISMTPLWFRAVTYPIDDNVVINRLNTETLGWDTTTPKGAFTLASGRATFSLRSFSCIDLSAERYGNALLGNPDQQTNPPTSTPPPMQNPTYTVEDCSRAIGPSVDVPVVCCVYQSTGSKTVTKNDTISASATTGGEIQTTLNIDVTAFERLIGKVNHGLQTKLTSSTSQTLTDSIQTGDTQSVAQGTTLTACECRTGTCRITMIGKKVTLKNQGRPDVDLMVYKSLSIVYCLKYVECANGCNAPGPHPTQIEQQPGQKICADSWPECKDS